MKHLSLPFGTALSVLLIAAASQVRADYMSWTYSSNPTPQGGISIGNGTATVLMSGYSSASTSGSTIPVITYTTSTTSNTPVSFGTQASPSTYSLALKITDSAGDSGTLNFNGALWGSLTATSSSLQTMLTPTTTNSVSFDGHTYTVNFAQTALAPPSNPTGQGYINATVSVSNASNSGGNNPGGPVVPPVGSVPEPASLLLGSLGFSCFGVGCWWKRRRWIRTIA